LLERWPGSGLQTLPFTHRHQHRCFSAAPGDPTLRDAATENRAKPVVIGSSA